MPNQMRPKRRSGQALLTSLCALALFAGICVAALVRPASDIPQPFNKVAAAGQFRDWDKPAIAIVLSGQMHGYLGPCGCSDPQYGGLDRRYNFMNQLKKKGWPVAAVDLGDAAQRSSPQRNLKYKIAMQALSSMNYAAIGIGKKEFDMSLLNALTEFTLNNPEPQVLGANILTPKTMKIIRDLVQGWTVIKGKNAPDIGVIGLVGRSVSEKVKDNDVAFAKQNGVVLHDALTNLKGKVKLTTLLYQGEMNDAKIAAKYAADLHKKDPQLPRLDVILCLSAEEEPPSVPTVIQGALHTLIIEIGHKGRYVGVVGAFPTGKADRPFAFKYQLVSIGPDLDTPKGQEKSNPIMALMDQYTREVRAGNYITKYDTLKHRVQVQFPNAKYVGSARCFGCHFDAFKIWEKSGHAHALKTLEDDTNPSLRQFDGECVVCHVIGFDHPTGYADALRANNTRMIKKLRDVGCESCHGPASEHIKNTKNVQIHAVMNPWKAQLNETPAQKARRTLKIDLFCQSCHDTDNDVHWNFKKKWPKIIHMSPKKAAVKKAAVKKGN